MLYSVRSYPIYFFYDAHGQNGRVICKCVFFSTQRCMCVFVSFVYSFCISVRKMASYNIEIMSIFRDGKTKRFYLLFFCIFYKDNFKILDLELWQVSCKMYCSELWIYFNKIYIIWHKALLYSSLFVLQLAISHCCVWKPNPPEVLFLHLLKCSKCCHYTVFTRPFILVLKVC